MTVRRSNKSEPIDGATESKAWPGSGGQRLLWASRRRSRRVAPPKEPSPAPCDKIVDHRIPGWPALNPQALRRHAGE